jgi:hypothetical protein
MTDRPHSGDEIAAACRIIEIHIEELSQLFDSMDPSPFHKKDLDRNAAEYIASSALDFPRWAPMALLVYVDTPARLADEGRVVGDAVREHFARESGYARRRLRQLLRHGWVSLAIGVTFLAAAVLAGALVGSAMREPWGLLARESLLIGGWVAMWRPLETFLYDWWPIVGERRRYDRLSRMAVRIEYPGA